MSNSLPTAPLPSTNLIKCDNPIKNKPPTIEECLWALEYPELQKACFLARICAENKPLECKLCNIGSILQVGPTCGLTALSMLLGGKPLPEKLLLEAQQKHFTNNGEMFSAHNLYKLICDKLLLIDNNNNANFSQLNNLNGNGTTTDKHQESNTKKNNVIECQMHEGLLNCAKVKESLKHGACIFVPYPFLKNLKKKLKDKT